MRLNEYQSKSLFAQSGIPVPRGKIAVTPQETGRIAEEFNTPVVIRPILHTTNNQNIAGQVAQTSEMAEAYALNILGNTIRDEIALSVLVEAETLVTSRIYVAILYDRELNKPIILVGEINGNESDDGEKNRDDFVYETIDPFVGFLDYQARDLASNINLPFEHWTAFTKITQNLFNCYLANDALFTEINPLVITDKNELLSLNGSVVIDQNALYRQPELAQIWDTKPKTEWEQLAYAKGMKCRKLNGKIACAVNGDGVAMTVMDMIALYGGETVKASHLINMGEEGNSEGIETALKIIFNDPDNKVTLINIFGGYTGCDVLAENIIDTIKASKTQIPIIIRFTGERAAEGFHRIKAAQLPNVCNTLTLTETVQNAIAASQGNQDAE